MTGINHLALQMTLGLARKQACHSVTLPVMCPCSLRQICPPLLWEFRAGEYTRRRIADVSSRPADTERLLLKFVRLTAHVNRNLNAFWLTTSIRNMFLNFTCILSFFVFFSFVGAQARLEHEKTGTIIMIITSSLRIVSSVMGISARLGRSRHEAWDIK